jgi:hypothetical protein
MQEDSQAILDRFEQRFDDCLVQIITFQIPYDDWKKGRRVEQFEQVSEWKAQFGYKFNIYGNDHLQDGKKHFHFENKAGDVNCKLDFEGNILEHIGKNPIPKNIYKILLKFLSSHYIKERLEEIWDDKNPIS